MNGPRLADADHRFPSMTGSHDRLTLQFNLSVNLAENFIRDPKVARSLRMLRRSVPRVVGRLTRAEPVDGVEPVDNASNTCARLFSSSSSSEAGPLHSETLEFTSSRTGADGERDTTVVLHGLLGNGRNLRSFVNTLFKRMVREQERRDPDALVAHRVLLMDLRHHGHTHSKGAYVPTTPDTLENCARDVFETLQACDSEHSGPLRIIGHSLGGKVALAAAKLASEERGPSCQIWTLDSFPFSFDETHTRNALGVLRILETIEGIVQPLESREELYEILDSVGFQMNLKEWLGSNLVGNPEDGYVWNFHLVGVDLERRALAGPPLTRAVRFARSLVCSIAGRVQPVPGLRKDGLYRDAAAEERSLVRWVLISTDVRPLVARPDSLTRATRFALRSFARHHTGAAVPRVGRRVDRAVGTAGEGFQGAGCQHARLRARQGRPLAPRPEPPRPHQPHDRLAATDPRLASYSRLV